MLYNGYKKLYVHFELYEIPTKLIESIKSDVNPY